MFFKDRSGMSLVETVVGGALLLGAGMLLTEAATQTTKIEKRYDRHFLMRQILDQASVEVFRRAKMYLPVNPEPPLSGNFKVYYACFSKKGVKIENQYKYVEWGLTQASNVPWPDPNHNEAPSNSFFVDEEVGYDGGDPPCSAGTDKRNDVHYIGFILPLAGDSGAAAHRTYVWVFAVDAGGTKIEGGLSTHITLAPYI